MDEVVEALEKYQGLVPLVYDIETMSLDEARPEDMQTAVYLKREADKVIAHQKIKRCEAMADYCSYKAWYYKYNGKEEKFYRWMKFRRIWVKLYNHFKEAK